MEHFFFVRKKHDRVIIHHLLFLTAVSLSAFPFPAHGSPPYSDQDGPEQSVVIALYVHPDILTLAITDDGLRVRCARFPLFFVLVKMLN